ncbi:MAG TPA: hypothetical protein DCE23_00430 [Firmicutes bacterium]|nr:hypothetical protein [Bacillota bacterium]
MYYFESFDEAIKFLEVRGGYNIGAFMQKETESVQAYRARIFRTASRIHECLENYPIEIYRYLSSHREQRQYTIKELRGMTYKELSEIRGNLGLSRRKRKKVIKEEPARRAYTQGIGYISETPTSTIVANAIINDTLDHEKDESILTEEEIAAMYGDDMPSLSVLLQMGIVPEFPEDYVRRTAYTEAEKNLQKKKK